MLHPVAHRTAKVWLKHRVAPISKKLRPQVECPVIAQPRAAVDIEYEWQISRLESGRGRAVVLHFHSAARAKFERTHLGELKLVELGSIAEQEVRLLRGAAPQEVPGRTVSALELNDPFAVIGVAAHDAEVAVIEATYRVEVRRDGSNGHDAL